MGENHKNGNRKEPLSVVIFWFIVVWAPRMFVSLFRLTVCLKTAGGGRITSLR